MTALPERLAQRSVRRLSHVLKKDDFETLLRPFESFCVLAEERNQAMATRMLDKMAQDRTKEALLVAGGFHTEGLTKYFRTHDVSYVVLTPRVDHLPRSNYVDVFAKDPLPLEEVFGGEPLFLLGERGLADRNPLWISNLLMAGLMDCLARFPGRANTKSVQAELHRIIELIGSRLQTLSPRLVGTKNGMMTIVFKDGREEKLLAISDDRTVTAVARPKTLLAKISDFLKKLFAPPPPLRVAHLEGLRLKRGGPSPMGESTLQSTGIDSVKEATKKNSSKIEVDDKTFYIATPILNQFTQFGFATKEDFERSLKDFFERQVHFSPPQQNEIVIALLDQSTHLFEDHQGNGFIGINRQLLELPSPHFKNALLFMGLRHELTHEANPLPEGKGLTDFETEQVKADAEYLWRALGERTLTREERDSLSELIELNGSFRIRSAMVNSKGSRNSLQVGKEVLLQPVYQDPTIPMWDPETETPIRDSNGEDFRNTFIGSQTAANRINGLIKKAKEKFPHQREVTLTKQGPEGGPLSITVYRVYLHDRTGAFTYVFKKSDLEKFTRFFSLKLKNSLPASSPSEDEIVVSISSLTTLGLSHARAQDLAGYLNRILTPGTVNIGGVPLTPTQRTVSGAPRWALPRQQLTELLSSHFVKNKEYGKRPAQELGAAGLWGSQNLLLVVFYETVFLSVEALWGMAKFKMAYPGQDLLEGILDVTLGTGVPLFITLFLIHFFTGVLQADGTIKKIRTTDFKITDLNGLKDKLITHATDSLRASATASHSFLMLPFFAAAVVLNLPDLIVIGFVFGAAAHHIPNKRIVDKAERRFLEDKTISMPVVLPVNETKEYSLPLAALLEPTPSLPLFGRQPNEVPFYAQLRNYQVTMGIPQNQFEFKLYLEYVNTRVNTQTKTPFIDFAAQLTPVTDDDVRSLLKSCRESPALRVAMAQWALAELMCAVGLRREGIWKNRSQIKAHARDRYMTERYLGMSDPADRSFPRMRKKTKKELNDARLIRATQMAAILRAAGYSVLNPLNKAGSPENDPDVLLLINAWGLVGHRYTYPIEYPYNRTIRAVLKSDLSTGEESTAESSSDTIEKTIGAIRFLKITTKPVVGVNFSNTPGPGSLEDDDVAFFSPGRPGGVLEFLKYLIAQAESRGHPRGSSAEKPAPSPRMEEVFPLKRRLLPEIKKWRTMRTQA